MYITISTYSICHTSMRFPTVIPPTSRYLLFGRPGAGARAYCYYYHYYYVYYYYYSVLLLHLWLLLYVFLLQ